jgi:uncharacterized protein (DUF952 family)
MASTQPLPDRIFHLARDIDWIAALQGDGTYRQSTADRTLEEEGFIHCSFAEQLQGTADRFYPGRPDVVLLAVDPVRLDAEVVVESGFPHVYGPIPVEAVVWAAPVPLRPSGELDISALLRA